MGARGQNRNALLFKHANVTLLNVAASDHSGGRGNAGFSHVSIMKQTTAYQARLSEWKH